MLNWGMGGAGTSFTSNREYGRGVLMSMQARNPNSNTPGNYNPTTISMGHGSAFTPGHSHSPTCPNFGTGMYSSSGQGQGHTHSPSCQNYGQGQVVGATSGIYSTGGDSATDFTVYVGDAAKDAMAQGQGQEVGGQQYNVNYNMATQANVSEGGFPMNFTDAGSGDQVYGQSQGQEGSLNVNDTPEGFNSNVAQNQSQPLKKMNGFQKFNVSTTMIPPPAAPITRGLGNKYKNRQLGDKGSSLTSIPLLPGQQQQHMYSSTRLRGTDSKPTFSLCGRCTKCKNLRDPGLDNPSILNFNGGGPLPNASFKGAPIPRASRTKPAQSMPSVSVKASSPNFHVGGVHSASGMK